MLDVRIKRADLPSENAKSVYQRMNAERERVSKGYRSQGQKDSTLVRNRTDLQAATIRAAAYRTSQRIRGEGDAAVVEIYAHGFTNEKKEKVLGFQSDREFFEFLRRLEAMQKTAGPNTEIIISPKGNLYEALRLKK